MKCISTQTPTKGFQKNSVEIFVPFLDKFVLTDHSANGTFVMVDGDKEIVLRREEFTLRGKGWIAFGQSKTTATDILEYFCE